MYVCICICICNEEVKNEMKEENGNKAKNGKGYFLKIEPEMTTGNEEKLQSEAKNQNGRNSKNKYLHYQQRRYCQ